MTLNTRIAIWIFLQKKKKNNHNILAHLASCRLSIYGDITEAELILGKEWVFVARQRPDLRACLYLPKFYSRDLLGKFWSAILFLRQEVQIAKYIDATTKLLTFNSYSSRTRRI